MRRKGVQRHNKFDVLSEFQQIPGIGKVASEELWSLGFRSIADLKNETPDALYQRLSSLHDKKMHKCWLYVFRLCVYYAKTPESRREPHLLKWNHWKD